MVEATFLPSMIVNQIQTVVVVIIDKPVRFMRFENDSEASENDFEASSIEATTLFSDSEDKNSQSMSVSIGEVIVFLIAQ